MGEVLWNVDWHGMFAPKNSVLEMAVRGWIMYFVIFA